MGSRRNLTTTRFGARVTARVAAIAACLVVVSWTAARGATTHYDAAMNYRLHCEGCHQADGSGQPGFIPGFRGNVARFLATSEGRTYLARVPGTAQSLLSDGERAEVLNWIIATFDPQHVPVQFTPYTEAELAPWRYDALSQPGAVRARLVAQLNSAAEPTAAGSEPPTAFAICSACHTVSKDGGNGVGPNLRGIVGRRAGTAEGFTYSPAMRSAGLTWTPELIDKYLTAPAVLVPGNFMAIAGISDVGDRKAIVDYLSTLH